MKKINTPVTLAQSRKLARKVNEFKLYVFKLQQHIKVLVKAINELKNIIKKLQEKEIKNEENVGAGQVDGGIEEETVTEAQAEATNIVDVKTEADEALETAQAQGEDPEPEPFRLIMVEMYCPCTDSDRKTIPLGDIALSETAWVPDMHCTKCGQIVIIKVLKN